MEIVTLVLFLLLAVVISGALARISPVPVPLPLVQILLGALIASVAHFGVELDPDVFFLLFLPPLLFLDGWRIPKQGLLRDKGLILELALGLVIFTVLGMGYLLHWMIPVMSLPVAFALAAVISPTDPIAVSAIAARVPIPKRLLHILEGESLLNDASGLVCMRFAVAAALTGAFSLSAAVLTFLWLVVAGVICGVAVTWGTSWAKNWISRHYGEETGSQILVSLLIPFAAYLLAEEIGGSGILAAVAAGISMSFAEQTGQALPVTRVRRVAVWDLVQFAANGVIFVLLGEQLPQIVRDAAAVLEDTGHRHWVWLIIYVIGVNLALASLRYAWVWTSLRLTLYRATKRGESRPAPSWRLVAATSLAGVRGAITLAGVLSLPLLLPNGAPLPGRDIAVFLAASVIILSLLAASVGLPYLLKGLTLPAETNYQEEEDRARIAAAEAAILAIERTLHDLGKETADADVYTEVGGPLMELYRQRITGRQLTGQDAADARRMNAIERQLRLAGLQAERDELYRIARNKVMSDEIARKLVREVDMQETRFGSP
jgi:CPA1 family monovalent cation:H+ antiporter